MTALENLKALLCDPDGKISIRCSRVDASIIEGALSEIEDQLSSLLGVAKSILKEWESPTEGIQKGELIGRLSQYASEARAAIKKAEGL